MPAHKKTGAEISQLGLKLGPLALIPVPYEDLERVQKVEVSQKLFPQHCPVLGPVLSTSLTGVC